MSRSTIILIARLLILATIAGLFWYGWQRYAALQWLDHTIEPIALSFQYPPDWRLDELTDGDVAKKIWFRATEPPKDPLPLLATIGSEDGLRLAANISKQELVPMILANSERAFPQRHPEFAKVLTKQYELDGHKAGEVIFTYKNPAGSQTKQRFVVIDQDGNTALYLAFQSKASDFDALNKDTFQRLLDSIQLR